MSVDATTIYQHPIPTDGPATEPAGPRSFTYAQPPPTDMSFDTAHSLLLGPFQPSAGDLYTHSQNMSSSSSSPSPDPSQGGPGANHYPSSSGVPRLPPILQVEKQQVTTSATQLASASRRRNEANFVCPVPGCGSTFTRRFNLRGKSAIARRRLRVIYS